MSYDFKKITVLIVDSQPAVIDLISGVLHLLGVRNIISRTDGKSGLHAIEKHHPDLVIIDWDLDMMDGLEFTKLVRSGSSNPFVPIIFMTAFTHANRVKDARDSGVTEFLKKPFSAQMLYKRIEEVIERPRRFIRTDGYFGPDRRRKRDGEYRGPEKRKYTPEEVDFSSYNPRDLPKK